MVLKNMCTRALLEAIPLVFKLQEPGDRIDVLKLRVGGASTFHFHPPLVVLVQRSNLVNSQDRGPDPKCWTR